jgi:hypothetical protein
MAEGCEKRDVAVRGADLRVVCLESDRIEDVRDEARGGGENERLNGSSSAVKCEMLESSRL